MSSFSSVSYHRGHIQSFGFEFITKKAGPLDAFLDKLCSSSDTKLGRAVQSTANICPFHAFISRKSCPNIMSFLKFYCYVKECIFVRLSCAVSRER